jgi:hypothetical protein
MILLSLASKQIWPHVLTVAYLKPAYLLLLHSKDETESRGPATRLKRFFDRSSLIPKGCTRLAIISDSDFNEIERTLDSLLVSNQFPLADCALNFTGGNKLMATAGFRWSARRGIRSFYLERRNLLTWFEPRDGDLLTRTEKIDGHITDNLDAVDLLRCQMDASEVERSGQTITLNQPGSDMPETEFFKRIANGNPMKNFLLVTGATDSEEKAGDDLEFNTAAVLLKLGVPRVQRSLRLKVKSAPHISSRYPHAEIDLLFNWNGRLWLVDCKDRKPTEDLVAALRRDLPCGLNRETELLLTRIANELKTSQTKALKEDLLAVRETGGLLGQIVCVRKSKLPDEVLQFARHNHIEVVPKTDLVAGFRALLFPDRPATTEELLALVNQHRDVPEHPRTFHQESETTY